MLNDHHRCTVGDQRAEHPQQGAHIQRVQADGRLIKDKHRVMLGTAHLAGQLQPLCLAAGKAGRLLAKGQVAQAQLLQHLQALGHQLQIRAGLQRRVDVHIHQLRQSVAAAVLVLVPYLVRVPAVAGAAALGARNLHIRQELHIQTDNACAIADRAAQLAGVVGEIARLITKALRIGGAGKNLAQLVMDVGIGCYCGAHIDADGRCVNQLDLTDAFCLHRLHVGRQGAARRLCRQRRDKAFQYQRGLAGAGDPRHHGQAALGKRHLQRLYRVDGISRKPDAPLGEKLLRRAVCGGGVPCPAQKGAYLGCRVRGQVGHRPLCNDAPAACARLGAHLNQPIGFRQHLGIMVNQHHRVAVRNQIVHHAVQPHDVGGVQPDGRLIQHIEHASGAVAHGAGQLHPLALPCGKGG